MKKIDWLSLAPESIRESESEDVFWWLGSDSLTERGVRFLSCGESFGGSGLNCLFISTHIFFCARGHHPPMQKRVTVISSNDESFGGSGTSMSGSRSLAVLIIVLLCSWAPPPVRERVNTHTHASPLFPAERVEVLVPTLKHKLLPNFYKNNRFGRANLGSNLAKYLLLKLAKMKLDALTSKHRYWYHTGATWLVGISVSILSTKEFGGNS